jgi:hypothetical protein
MDAVFEMYLAKELEVVVRTGIRRRECGGSPHGSLELKVHQETCAFYRGLNMEQDRV